MGALADKANDLIGRSRADFQCNQVINQIFFDKKDAGKLAKDYLSWGVETSLPAEGVVVVGKDGAHVGVFVNENEFIHSSTRQFQVIKVGKDQLPWVFPQGWVYRKER